MNEKLLAALYTIITPEKIEKFDWIASERTNYLTAVVENIYQEHNASAVMRTCDCFGIRDLHIIEKNNHFSINQDIAKGAGQWIQHYHYDKKETKIDPTLFCLDKLKTKGYKIVATTPHTTDYTIHDVPIDEPIAVVFGTEHTGLTDQALEQADYKVRIPMVGFTESINISVSAALTIQTLRRRLEIQDKINWRLTKEEQTTLKIEWCKKIIRNPENVIRGLRKRIKNGEL